MISALMEKGENDDDTEINTNNGGLFEDYYIVRKFNTTRR